MADRNGKLINMRSLATCANPDCEWSEINPRRKPRKCPRCKSTVRITDFDKK